MENSIDNRQFQKNSLIKIIKPLLISLLFIFIFLRYLYPVYYGRDTDIFWHLKTGEIIFNEHHIPTSDPFTYTPGDPLREKVILTSYWLADLILFISYKTLGFTGLAILRSTIICLTVLLVYISILRRGFFISVILSLMLGFALMPTSTIRPNLFSFLFVAAMIFFMERYKKELRKRYQIGLIIIMLLWANMHGGYIVGVGILIIYIIAEAIVLLPPLRKKESTKKAISVCLTAGAAITVTLINPVGISPFLIAGGRFINPAKKLMTSHIETEMGFFKIISQYPNEMILLSLIIIGFILVYTALNLTRRRAGLAETSIVLALLILSIISIRVLPIFLIAGLIVSGGKKSYDMSSIKMSNRIRIILNSLLMATICFFIFIGFPKANPGKLIETDSIYLRMGKFLDENKINGNMLNREFTGNFIIFELYPKYKVFTDSRYINVDVFFDGLDMFYAIKEPTNQKDAHYMDSLAETCIKRLKGEYKKDYSKEYWYSLLEKYKIDVIVGRISHPKSGQLFPLFLKLMYDDTWKLIYMDGNAVIMIKDNNKNDDILKKFPPQDKFLLYDQAIRENIEKHSANAYETLAFAFLMKGDIKNAKIFAKNALIINKNLKIAKACLQFIDLLNLRSS